jgi:NAD(P)-dependent dehydrogenase (short-subunit alcohol dehydrogenase family)
MADELAGKIIFLTGGGRGIGQACSKGYTQAGATVVIADIDDEQARKTAASLPTDQVYTLHCDVSNADSVNSAVQKTLERYGRIDVVHNNAGVSSPSSPLHQTSEAQWDRLFSVNVKSIHLTTCAAIEALKKSRGCILNTASMVGLLGQDNHAAYVATKGAIIALTKAMALDYACAGIRVNAICPAAIWTPLLRQWVQEQPDPCSTEDFLNDIHVLGYCPDGDVIADTAVFLVSEKARFITGVAMPVSGGAELGYRHVVNF